MNGNLNRLFRWSAIAVLALSASCSPKPDPAVSEEDAAISDAAVDVATTQKPDDMPRTSDLAETSPPTVDVSSSDSPGAPDAPLDLGRDLTLDLSDESDGAVPPPPCGPEYEVGCPEDFIACEDFDGGCDLHGFAPCRLEEEPDGTLTIAFWWFEALPGCQGHCAESEVYRTYTFDPSSGVITLLGTERSRADAQCNVPPFDPAQTQIEVGGERYTLHEMWGGEPLAEPYTGFRNSAIPSEELWVKTLRVEDVASGVFLYDVDFPLFENGVGKVPVLR